MTTPDLSGIWRGTKSGRPATLKHLELDARTDGSLRVSYVYNLGGRQTGFDGGAGCGDLEFFVGPKAIYHRVSP